MNTIDGDKYLKDNYSQYLFDYFVKGGEVYGYEININLDDFNKIFSVIYDNIKLKLSEDEVKKAFLQYVQLIMSDAREGKFVEINYFIDCVDYLGLDILDNKFLKKLKKYIKPIKKSLRGEFPLSNKIKK